MSDFGWVTLATNDTYCLGALVVAHSLKRVKTKHRLAVIITPQVSPAMRDHLSTVFDVIHQVDVLDSKDAANLALLQRPDLGVTFTKIHCWNLTQFKKCVFIDADTLVIQNCDELFERNELSASADPGWPDCFNSGVFVFVPSQKTFNDLLAFASTNGSFDGGDQGLLNMFFSDWSSKDISKHLPFLYNMCSTFTYTYLPALKYYGVNIKIVHFIGSNKPWLQGGTGGSLSGFLHIWWQIFESSIAPNLNRDMSGLAGALGSREKDVIEEQWRKQNWEQGNIDYTGKDSFDNIWQKIMSTMNKAGSKQQQAAPSDQVKETHKKDELSSKDMQIMPFTPPPEPPKEKVIIPLPDKDTSGITKLATESVQFPTPSDVPTQKAQTTSVFEQKPTSDVAVAQTTLIQASGQPTFAQKVSSQPPSSAPQVPLSGAPAVTPQTPPVVSPPPPAAQPTFPAVQSSPPVAPTVQPAAPPTPAAEPTTPVTPAAEPPATPTSQSIPSVSSATDPAPQTTLTATHTPPAFPVGQPAPPSTPTAQPTPIATPAAEPAPMSSPTAQNTPPASPFQPSFPASPIAQSIPSAAPTAVPTSQPTPPGTPASEVPLKLVQQPPSTPPVTQTTQIAAPLEAVTLTSAISPFSPDVQIKPKESQFPPSSQGSSPLVLDLGQNKAVGQIPPTEETKNEKPFPPPVPKTPTDSVPKTPTEPYSVQSKIEVAKSNSPLEEINKIILPVEPPKKQDKKTPSPPKDEGKKETNVASSTQGNKKTDGNTPPPSGDQSKKTKPQTPPEQSKKGKNKGQAPTPIKDSSQPEQSNKEAPKVGEAETKTGEQPSKEAQGKNSKQGQKQRKSPPGKSEAPAPPPAKQQKKQPQVATTHPLEEVTAPLTPPPSPLDKPATEEPCSSLVVIAPTPPVSPPEVAATAPEPLSTKLKVEVDAPPTPPAGVNPPVPPKRKGKGGNNNQDKKPHSNGGGKGKGKK